MTDQRRQELEAEFAQYRNEDPSATFDQFMQLNYPNEKGADTPMPKYGEGVAKYKIRVASDQWKKQREEAERRRAEQQRLKEEERKRIEAEKERERQEEEAERQRIEAEKKAQEETEKLRLQQEEQDLIARREQQKIPNQQKEDQQAVDTQKEQEMNELYFQAAQKSRPDLTFQQFMAEREADKNREMTPKEYEEYVGRPEDLHKDETVDTKFIGQLYNDDKLTDDQKKYLAMSSEKINQEFKDEITHRGGYGEVLSNMGNLSNMSTEDGKELARLAQQVNDAINSQKKSTAFGKGLLSSVSFGGSDWIEQNSMDKDKENGMVTAFDKTVNDLAKESNRGFYNAGEFAGEVGKAAILTAATGGIGGAAGTVGNLVASNVASSVIDNGITSGVQYLSGKSTGQEALGDFAKGTVLDSTIGIATGKLLDGKTAGKMLGDPSVVKDVTVENVGENTYKGMKSAFLNETGASKLTKDADTALKSIDKTIKQARKGVRPLKEQIRKTSDGVLSDVLDPENLMKIGKINAITKDAKKEALKIAKDAFGKDASIVNDAINKNLDIPLKKVNDAVTDITAEKVISPVLNTLITDQAETLVDAPFNFMQERAYQRQKDEEVGNAMDKARGSTSLSGLDPLQQNMLFYDIKKNVDNRLRNRIRTSK